MVSNEALSPVIAEFNGVSFRYKGGNDVLKDIHFSLAPGSFHFMTGESGAGKTSLLGLLYLDHLPTKGRVRLFGQTVDSLSRSAKALIRRKIGVVFQDYRLIETMTVYENIAFVLRVIDAPTKLIRKRVPYVMSLVGLTEKADSYPSELSGGEQQRCALARALVNEPALLIADEPTGNVDPELAYELVELLKGINDCGTTVLMVTHAHEMVRHFGGRIINIDQGEVVFDEVIEGAEADYYEDTDADYTAEADASESPVMAVSLVTAENETVLNGVPESESMQTGGTDIEAE